MRIVVTGAGGQLGHAIAQVARNRHDVLALTHSQLDILTDPIPDADLLINCAAYTAVDRAQNEPEKAWAVNHEGAAILAKKARRMVHISTDYVFDGTKGTPYTEDDPTNPLNVYGASKLAGEQAVLQHPQHSVIRTSWLFGDHGHNFVKAILKQAREGRHLRVVADQTGCPTAAAHLAQVALNLEEPGLHHYCDTPATTWYGFAKAILEKNALDNPITATTSEGLPTPRPRYTVLACRIPQKRWEDAL